MDEKVQKLITAERKNARDLKVLMDLRAKMHQHKTPDQKMIGLIDIEIAKLKEQK